MTGEHEGATTCAEELPATPGATPATPVTTSATGCHLTATPRHPAVAVRFTDNVRLTKGEVFAACQVLADAERHLRAAGHLAEAEALWHLFDLLERRLCVP